MTDVNRRPGHLGWRNRAGPGTALAVRAPRTTPAIPSPAAQRIPPPGDAVAGTKTGSVPLYRPCNASSISMRTSPTCWARRFKSPVRHRRSTVLTLAGVGRGRSVQSGALVTIAARTSVRVSPLKSCWPANISYSTQPNAQTSVRRSTTFPRACSGLIYAAVPMMTPLRVAAAVIQLLRGHVLQPAGSAKPAGPVGRHGETKLCHDPPSTTQGKPV